VKAGETAKTIIAAASDATNAMSRSVRPKGALE
jgi:hypothetical protein